MKRYGKVRHIETCQTRLYWFNARGHWGVRRLARLRGKYDARSEQSRKDWQQVVAPMYLPIGSKIRR